MPLSCRGHAVTAGHKPYPNSTERETQSSLEHPPGLDSMSLIQFSHLNKRPEEMLPD